MTARPRPRALVAVAAAALALLAGCGGAGGTTAPAPGVACGAAAPPAASPGTYPEPPPTTIDPAARYTAVIATSCGDIRARLDPRLAPVAVNSFVFLAREGFYDGLTFHRVARDYVVQGGDPGGDGRGGPGYAFGTEPPPDGYPVGSLALANAGPGTNGSQFFIVIGDASFLPPDYTRFGRVTSGLGAARRMQDYLDPALPPGDPQAQRPTRTIYIESVRIEERTAG